MGFQIGRVFDLDFTDTDAAGAVVKMKSCSVGNLIAFREANDERFAELLAQHVKEWNLEDDGIPVPVTAAGVLSLEKPFVDLIYVEWLRATRGITVPFDRRSNGGGPSPTADEQEPSIPMDDL